MVEISISSSDTTATLPFPSTWNELTTPELEAVATALTSTANEWENKISLFIKLVELRATSFNIKLPYAWPTNLNPEDIAIAGIDAINFLFSTNERSINPYPKLKLPGIFGARSTFYGPANDFNDITCAELEDAEHLIDEFSKTKQIATLASLAAIFWRLPINNNVLQRRQNRFPYDEVISQHYHSHFLHLPVQKLMACYIYIIGSRNNLPKYFPGPYGTPEQGEGKADPTSFTKTIHAGAGVKNGTRENIRKMLAKEFLFDLQQEFDNAKEQEKQLKKVKAKEK